MFEKIMDNATLAEQAYNIIKKSIVNGDLNGNEELPEEKLAKDLGISRTPLRDALNNLAAEGLIIQKKGAPAVVADFTENESLEYMELRSLLEIYNIEKIITKITNKDIYELKENLKKQHTAIEQNSYSDFIEQDRQFHLLLSSINQNTEITKVIRKMNTGLNRAFIILSKTVPQSAEEAYIEHLELLDALIEKDLVLARKKMTVHMNNVEKRFLKYSSQKKDENT